MKRLCVLILTLFVVAAPALAQTGGPVIVKAVDTATGATTDVGDNTNHGIRVNVVAGSVAATQSGTWNIGTVTTVTTVAALTSITNAVITKPIDACGTTNQDFQALIADTTLDTVTSTTTCVDSITVSNKGAAQTTLLLQDITGTPLVFAPTVPIAPNTSITFSNLGGVKFNAGIKVQASNANNLTYFIKGRQ
jgi:hypothetical protein